MSGPDRPDWEDDTLPTPRVRDERGPDERPPAGTSPAGTAPAQSGPSRPRPATSSSDTVEMPPLPARERRPRAARRAASSEQVSPARSGGARKGRRAARLALLGLAIVAAAGAGVLAGRLVPESSSGPATVAAAGSADAAVDAAWSSVDPVGGSGFRQIDAATWRTQSYRSAEFGNLKPGVGLLADLGTARSLSAVTVDVAPSGVVVELRAGDTASQDPEDYEVIAAGAEATGPTSLDASGGGEHRYWLVWVTELGPREGGFVAELSDPGVEP